ncbi:hypothetical protein XENTR_v10021320 [Xenopus tropicalis]|uniref:Chromosome 6 open reading frame 136 n=2 Tax=Xenopus tropicalis TaxID=8364 RepID=A0A6I8PTL6_XENTR|nr:uncharacterized protein C6orf136 homolog [Xenopus tropicalis]KAE8585477.1 hypothetical protein XENTR_v10021320 [Xenopus tropicalis]|eukprot:NP_001011197.2 uncharacterized protein C6orf136 homolog [Xenopus tropicalis]
MSLCVRRLRGAQGLGVRWRNGVRGAGGAAGRVREEARLHDIGWPPELNPRLLYPTSLKNVLPSTTTSSFTRPKYANYRQCPPFNGREKHQRHLRSTIAPLRTKLHMSKPHSSYLPCTSVGCVFPVGKDTWHLSSAQLDCFRSLFEPGVCRTPYQAVAFPVPGTQHGILAFQPSKKMEDCSVPGNNQPDMEQQLAIMHAKLREELPDFLLKSMDYSIYRKDVEFVCSVLHIHTRGIILYQLLLTLSRFLFLSYLSNASVSILKLTSHPETCSIQARWAISGLPLHTLLFHFYRTDKTELYKSFDAHSTFYVASDGLIHLHKLERVMPSQPLTVPKKTLLTAALVALGLGENRPALNLLSSPKASPKL